MGVMKQILMEQLDQDELDELFQAAEDGEFNDKSNAFLLDLKARGVTAATVLSKAQRAWVDDLIEKLHHSPDDDGDDGDD